MNLHRLPYPAVVVLSLVLGACTSMGASSDAGAAAETPEILQPVSVPQIDLPPARKNPPAQTKGQPYQFADAVPVTITAAQHGLWSAWDENNDRWRVDLTSKGARSLNLHFDRFVLPQGAVLRLYPPEQPRRGVQLTAADNKSHGAYWSPEIAGDTLRLDLILPRSYNKQVELSIADVNVAW